MHTSSEKKSAIGLSRPSEVLKKGKKQCEAVLEEGEFKKKNFKKSNKGML